MSMVTQCPHCSTAFNVTPEQLFARDGRVRCGNCRQAFDGLVNLTSLEALEAGVPPPLAEASEAELQAQAQSMVAAEHAQAARDAAPGFSPVSWPMLPDVPVVPMPPQAASIVLNPPQAASIATDTAATSTATDAPPAAPAVAAAKAPPAADAARARVAAVSNTDDDSEDAEEHTAPRRHRWAWAAAAGVAALLLCAQLLHSFRSEIAAYFPRLKPVLAQFCALAQCTVPPLQKPSVLAIQASDLLILDKAKPNLVQLIVTLQNQSGVDVAYPAIDLTLNDRFEHAVARRVFLPAEYLRGDEAQKTVIAASVTTTVRIDLDISELAAGGFGLLLIAAPQT